MMGFLYNLAETQQFSSLLNNLEQRRQSTDGFTYVVWWWQRVLMLEGQGGELGGVVGRGVTITGVAV